MSSGVFAHLSNRTQAVNQGGVSVESPVSFLRVIENETRDGFFNMGADEYLFRAHIAHEFKQATLRFYRFSEPTFTVGYGAWRGIQSDPLFAHVQTPVIRRLTGGGVVVHGRDLTYSLIVPIRRAGDRLAKDPTVSFSRVVESYRVIHTALQQALRDIGIRVTLCDLGPARPNRYCFDAPVRNDLLLGNKKIAGAGQKRSSGRLLHQGSIAWDVLKQAEPALSEHDFRIRFTGYLAKTLQVSFQETPLLPEERRGIDAFSKSVTRLAVGA